MSTSQGVEWQALERNKLVKTLYAARAVSWRLDQHDVKRASVAYWQLVKDSAHGLPLAGLHWPYFLGARQLASARRVAQPLPSTEVELVWVRGEIENAGAKPAVVLERLILLSRPAGVWTGWRPEVKPADPYRVRLLDGGANVLVEVSCGWELSVQLPWDPRARAVLVADASGNVLARRDATPNKPRLEIMAPRPNAVLSGVPLDLEWKASDADGDSLRSDVRYSADGGATWMMLLSDGPEQKLSYGARLKGGKQAYVEVTVSDGFWVVRERSGPFSMPLNAPTVQWLVEPSIAYVRGTGVELTPYASDVEDRAPMVQDFVFSSNLDGELGRGRWLRVNEGRLRPGLHTITASTRDSDGLVGTATATLRIPKD